MTPHAAVNVIERDACILRGPGDAFSGYAVIGLPFQSGHVLALRRFSASSLGPVYTSVPASRSRGSLDLLLDGRARPVVCAVLRRPGRPQRGHPDRARAWAAPCALRVSIRGRLTWQLTMGSSPMTRLLNTMTSLIPERAWRMPAVFRGMGLAADAAFGTGHLNLRGRTPNGHRFVMNPRQFWLLNASTAHMSGHDLGPPGPLEEPATLEDMRIPQRGLFAVLSLRLARPTRGRATLSRHGQPCSPIAKRGGGSGADGVIGFTRVFEQALNERDSAREVITRNDNLRHVEVLSILGSSSLRLSTTRTQTLHRAAQPLLQVLPKRGLVRVALTSSPPAVRRYSARTSKTWHCHGARSTYRPLSRISCPSRS